MGVILSTTHKEILAKLIEELRTNVAFGHAGDLMLEAAQELENYLSFNVRRYGGEIILPYNDETAQKYAKKEAMEVIGKALIEDGIIVFEQVETITGLKVLYKTAVVVPDEKEWRKA